MQPAAVDANESAQDSGLLINMLDPANILRWSLQLVVTPIELKQAVAKVGSSVAKVRAYFGLSEFEVWPVAARYKTIIVLEEEMDSASFGRGPQNLSVRSLSGP